MGFFQTIGQHLSMLRWTDLLDIVIVTFLIYKLLPLFRTTGSSRIAKAIIGIFVLSWLTSFFKLHILSYLTSQILQIGLIAVVVLFQPELRRMLDHLGRFKLSRLVNPTKPEQEMVPVINQTVRACEMMSKEKVGALIVFARDSHLDEYFKTGTVIDGQVSQQLLRNIFFPKSALHDGAVIVCEGRVTAAGCVLPLSETNRLSADLGTRHRAAVGMSEASDAVVVVVSEETGAISVAVGGMLKRHLAPQTLEKLLRNELCQPEVEQERSMQNLINKIKPKSKEEKKNEK